METRSLSLSVITSRKTTIVTTKTIFITLALIYLPLGKASVPSQAPLCSFQTLMGRPHVLVDNSHELPENKELNMSVHETLVLITYVEMLLINVLAYPVKLDV